jgi:hypothetical protein
MRNIAVERQMATTAQAVWGVLADFGNIADWNGGVKKSFSTGEQTEGIGATRHCDLTPLGGLEETVRGWKPNEQMIVSIDSTSKLPIKHGEVTFDITEANEEVVVALSYDYDTKFGPVGRLMGPLLDKQLSSGFKGFLEDLEKAAVAEPA